MNRTYVESVLGAMVVVAGLVFVFLAYSTATFEPAKGDAEGSFICAERHYRLPPGPCNPGGYDTKIVAIAREVDKKCKKCTGG